MPTRIAIIHATRLAVDPIAAAFNALWPEAERLDLLDQTLSIDRARSAEITPALTARFIALAEYAQLAGAAGILFSCSAFGPCIDAARRAVALPILKPNEAMFREALGAGSRLGLIATFEPSIAPMRDELLAMAAESGCSITLEVVCVPEAFAALDAGDGERHDRLVAQAAAAIGSVDAVMLAQFSMARAATLCRQSTTAPLFTSPECAAAAMKSLVSSA